MNLLSVLGVIKVTKAGISGEWNTLSEKRDVDFSFSREKSFMSYDPASSSLHQQQIQSGEEFWKPVVVGGKS